MISKIINVLEIIIIFVLSACCARLFGYFSLTFRKRTARPSRFRSSSTDSESAAISNFSDISTNSDETPDRCQKHLCSPIILSLAYGEIERNRPEFPRNSDCRCLLSLYFAAITYYIFFFDYCNWNRIFRALSNPYLIIFALIVTRVIMRDISRGFIVTIL